MNLVENGLCELWPCSNFEAICLEIEKVMRVFLLIALFSSLEYSRIDRGDRLVDKM